MNVANRKLFANRDARKKLAEMGGILASSPELLGEAQKFAEAGQVDVQMYVINVPGLTAPGEYLKVSEETLMQLNDIVPQLMSQQETLVEPAEAVEGLVDVRPGDALLPKRLRDIGAIPDQAPVPTVQEPVDDRSVSPPGRYGLGDAIDAINEMGLGLAETGVVTGLSPSQKFMGPGVVTGLSPSQKFQSESLNPMNIGPTELNQPAVRNALRDPNAPSAGLASSLQEAAARGPVAPVVASETMEDRIADDARQFAADRRSFPQPLDRIVIDPPVQALSDAPDPTQGLSIGDQMIAQGFTGGDIDPTRFPTAEEREMAASISAIDDFGDYLLSPKTGEGLVSGMTIEEKLADPVEATKRLFGLESKSEAAAEATQTVDAERLQMSGFPDATYLGGLTEQIFENKADVTKFLALNAEQLKKKKQAAEQADGTDTATDDKGDGTTPPPPADDDKTDKILKMSTEEATKEYYKSLKELFGLSDEDKARDLSLTMAQFGFAMAAGQSPNALTNIANAAGAALAQMRQTQATEREREDKLKLMAFTEARADEKEARELDRLLAKETRADKRELALYISKLQAKAALDPDVKTYLETPEGKAALGMYKDLIGNTLLDADEVVSTFIQQAGDLAPDFLKYLGLGAETGGNAGGQDNDDAVYNKIGSS